MSLRDVTPEVTSLFNEGGKVFANLPASLKEFVHHERRVPSIGHPDTVIPVSKHKPCLKDLLTRIHFHDGWKTCLQRLDWQIHMSA